MVKKAFLMSRTVKWVLEEEMKEKSIGIWDYWVYGDNSHTDKSQVMDQAIGVIWLFEG